MISTYIVSKSKYESTQEIVDWCYLFLGDRIRTIYEDFSDRTEWSFESYKSNGDCVFKIKDPKNAAIFKLRWM